MNLELKCSLKLKRANPLILMKSSYRFQQGTKESRLIQMQSLGFNPSGHGPVDNSGLAAKNLSIPVLLLLPHISSLGRRHFLKTWLHPPLKWCNFRKKLERNNSRLKHELNYFFNPWKWRCLSHYLPLGSNLHSDGLCGVFISNCFLIQNELLPWQSLHAM